VELRMSMPALVNAHTHSLYGPHLRGVIPAQTFESYMVDISVRYLYPETPEEAYALALVTGLDNLSAGHSAIIDSCYVPLTKDYLYGIAQAYEDLGLKAWVFTEIADLPLLFYTKEAYPNYSNAIPMRDLPEDLQEMCEFQENYRDQLDALEKLIREWQGKRVRIGIGLTNPVWCSDELMFDAANLAQSLGVPISFHVEESPLQRRVHIAQWGKSGIQRAAELGLLSPHTLLLHAVQVDEVDISHIADSGSSVCYLPISNLKIRNGIAPIGKMISAGINVCLGTDGHSVEDVENLFPVMRFVTALAELNGIGSLGVRAEDLTLKMATENGYSLWFEEDFEEDRIEFSSPIGPYGHVWDDPTAKINEVYVNGVPRLEAGRQIVASSNAKEIVEFWSRKVLEPETVFRARTLAEWVEKTTQRWLEDL
jgi:5-methylthioadenosine/S-adenosylhomocysteine deaminase